MCLVVAIVMVGCSKGARVGNDDVDSVVEVVVGHCWCVWWWRSRWLVARDLIVVVCHGFC